MIMKKWQIITGISAAAVILLSVAGYGFYRFYAVPHYISPIAEKIGKYLSDDKVLAELYENADQLHDEGVLSDSVYTKFITEYEKHTRNDLEYARSILDRTESDNNNSAGSSTSLSAKYASHKVGIEIIQTNDEDTGGKSDLTYSDTRTSKRVNAEDLLEAEKIIDESQNESKNASAAATEEPELTEESAYKILKENMSGDEYSLFTALMMKLDTKLLENYYNNDDREALRDYLLSKLNIDEYNNLKSLAYKYAYLFMKK